MADTSIHVASRLRGAALAGIAILLLLLGLLLMGVLRPHVGAVYPGSARLLICSILAIGYLALLAGVGWTIVGPGVGPLAGLLKVLAALVLLAGLGLGALGGFIAHAVLTSPVTEVSGGIADWDD